MELDIKAAERAVPTVEDAANKVERSLNCEWEDSVHESFYGFVDVFFSINKKVQEICDNTKSVAKSVECVDVKKLQNVLNTLINSMPKEKR